MSSDYEEQYLAMFNKILAEGVWVDNKRTGTRCLTIPRHVYEIPLKEDSCPLLTTRPSYPVSAVAEMIGYNRQLTNATKFDAIGAGGTWGVNANQTQAWLDNPHRLGENQLGLVYGASLPRSYIKDVWDKISRNEDDRRLILNWWQVDSFDKCCLVPCLNQHNFTLLGGKTYLTSTQRSLDSACGCNYNAISIYFLGMLANKLSGNSGGEALHVINNAHIYEDHINGIGEL